MNIDNMIGDYLRSKRDAWASSTQTSEAHRLNAVKDVLDGDPEKLWRKIKELAPYSRKTTWTRVVDFWDFAAAGPNPYRQWRKEKAKHFKNTYLRQAANVSFQDAKQRIEGLEDADERAHALVLLLTGARFSESLCIGADGTVTGKGAKQRQLQVPAGFSNFRPVQYQQLRRALKSVGLKPHMLRKIFLTELAARGADAFELCEISGWETPATALSYIRAAKAQQRVKELQGSVQVSAIFQREPKPAA